jgi:DNA-binding response OmpR family regulator
VFKIDDKTRLILRRRIERVLVVDPHLAAARLLTDLLTELGAGQRLTATTTARALNIAREWEPQLIFIEFAGPALDGVDFTRRLRRSSLVARRAPVIIVTAETREASIKAARDSGAHEFLCKPFTAGHVFRRVENVMLKPRPWIEAKMYVGPDRRRFNSGQYLGDRKRGADAAARPVEGAVASSLSEGATTAPAFII